MALIGMHLATGVQSPGPVESIVLGSLKQEHIGKILEETKDLSQSVQDLLKLKPGTEQMKLFIEEVFNITRGLPRAIRATLEACLDTEKAFGTMDAYQIQENFMKNGVVHQKLMKEALIPILSTCINTSIFRCFQ